MYQITQQLLRRLSLNKYLKYIAILSLILLIGCIKEPTAPVQYINSGSGRGAFILWEGIWGMDNSLLSRYTFDNDSIISDYYSFANPGNRLGDVANDIVIWKETAYIVMTSAKTIISIDINTGKLKDRIILEGRRAPRKITVLSDSIAAVTDLYDHSITMFNPSTMKLIKEHIYTGPAPEGIAQAGNSFYVVNSGYGDYLQNQPKASTLSVIDVTNGTELINIAAGVNPLEVIVNSQKSKLYIAYYNLPSKPDSLGGIIEYDLMTLTKLREWRCQVRSITLSPNGDSLFFLSNKGVDLIDLNKNEIPKNIINNPKPSDIWYSLAYSVSDNTIWVGNSRNHQIDGEILVYSKSNPGTPIKKFTTGLNPGKIVFY